MVRRTGGLNDTVIDIGDWQGYGICFSHASLDDILEAMERALHIFKDKPLMHEVRGADDVCQ